MFRMIGFKVQTPWISQSGVEDCRTVEVWLSFSACESRSKRLGMVNEETKLNRSFPKIGPSGEGRICIGDSKTARRGV